MSQSTAVADIFAQLSPSVSLKPDFNSIMKGQILDTCHTSLTNFSGPKRLTVELNIKIFLSVVTDTAF